YGQTGELEMGTGYDCFDELSHTANGAINSVARSNRLLLRLIMEKHGFDNYSREWWHYTYRAEPFRDEYFDFPVR
ncbi:MAG: D-alanyl-D-alanine dipeptidase, partial [Rhodothermales bacterium]|nr:D-alanyl-D-alanine dipeptidase [Rhodothermales bacterium]